MIELQALGPLDVRDDGGPLQGVLAQPKRAALLVYLALARPRGYHSRDALTAVFWPESDQKRARNSLSQSLSYLRRELPPELLVTRGPDVKVEADRLRADVLAFEAAVSEERWQEALALYRGELLAGFHVSDAPDFERWLDLERERLRELAARAAWARANAHIAAGDPVEAERAAQRAIQLAPTDETPVREFIQALAGSGERAAALWLYDRFCAILAETLQVEPSPETVAVAEAVRDGLTPTATGRETPDPPDREPIRPTPAAGEHQPVAGPPDDPGSQRPAVPAPPDRRPGRLVRRRIVLVAIGVLTLAAAVSVRMVGAPNAPSPRVVVLPFGNRTGDTSLEPVGPMVADWVSNGLMQVPEIEIVPRAVVAEALVGSDQEDEAAGVPALGRVAATTGATTALTGVFYRRGDSLEFHTQLFDLASHDAVAIIEPVRAPLTDPLQALDSVQSQVMGALATRYSPLVSWELPPAAQPPTWDAHLAFLRGVKAWDVGDFHEGARWFNEGFARDTTYLRSLLWAWSSYRNAGRQHEADSLLAILRTRRERLSRYDQYWLDVYSARTRGDYRAFLTAARKAVRLNPTGPLRLSLVLALVYTNRPTEAREQLEDWLESLPPAARWYALRSLHTTVLHLVGDYREELEVARRHGDEVPAGNLSLAEAEARALAAVGDLEAFQRRIGEIEVLASQPLLLGQALGNLAAELRAHGHREASLELVGRALRGHEQLPPQLRDSRQGSRLAASLLYLRERWAEAADRWASLERDARDLDLIHAVGSGGAAAARLGGRATAEAADQQLARLESATPESLGLATLYRARIAAVLGHRDRAVTLLRQAFAQGQPFGLWLHRDMDLESLRGFAPYEELVEPGK